MLTRSDLNGVHDLLQTEVPHFRFRLAGRLCYLGYPVTSVQVRVPFHFRFRSSSGCDFPRACQEQEFYAARYFEFRSSAHVYVAILPAIFVSLRNLG